MQHSLLGCLYPELLGWGSLVPEVTWAEQGHLSCCVGAMCHLQEIHLPLLLQHQPVGGGETWDQSTPACIWGHRRSRIPVLWEQTSGREQSSHAS